MNILFAASECVPFAKSGGLADVIGSLPSALRDKEFKISVVLPLYKTISEAYGKELEYITSFHFDLAWRRPYAGLFKLKKDNITYYFVDNLQYFDRDSLYGYYDDGERFSYFSKACLEMLPFLDDFPDIVHCHDWQTALIPVYLKVFFDRREKYSKLRTVFTIHNIEYQGKCDITALTDVLGIPERRLSLLEQDGLLNFMKGAVVTCDKLTTVSPTYAEEITYPYYGHRLEWIIKENGYKLRGILNGIDKKLYNPLKDPALAENYGMSTLSKKTVNKEALQEETGLAVRADAPLIGMITRLVDHKGIGLIMRVFDELMHTKDVQFVILGTGDKQYENFFREKAFVYPGRVSITTAFAPVLASRIYGGADIFLMPSISEPCGLAQMISLRYGTVPVVRETGGLKDSIEPFNPTTGEGNGFTFGTVNAHDMLGAVNRAIDCFYDKKMWTALMKNGMRSDFSWKRSALEYKEVYSELGG